MAPKLVGGARDATTTPAKLTPDQLHCSMVSFYGGDLGVSGGPPNTNVVYLGVPIAGMDRIGVPPGVTVELSAEKGRHEFDLAEIDIEAKSGTQRISVFGWTTG